MDILTQRVQVSNATKFNRYPNIFTKVAEFTQLEHAGKIRLLSFGCSTGKEIESLDSMYLNGCELVGVDINEKVLAEANQISFSGNNSCSFVHSSEFSTDVKFDVVLAMSVLCRWPDTQHVANICNLYPFTDFVKQMDDLDSLIAAGGLIALHNSNYYFEDTELFQEKYTIYAPDCTDIGFVTRFDTNSKKYTKQKRGYVFFRKEIS